MQTDCFKFEEIGFFSKLLIDYTSGKIDKSLLPEFDYSISGIKERLTKPYPLKIDRNILAQTLLQQYEGIEATELVLTHIELLKKTNTYTVVTAHQLSFMGGPLYYVIKIANAIALSQKLAKDFPDYHFVPIYWMGSEDHDFEEVNHIYLFKNKITWDSTQQGPVGRFTLDGIKDAVQEVLNILGQSKPDGIEELIEKAYAQKDMQMATRVLVNGLFGQYGLVIVDGDDSNLKRPISDLIFNEITKQASFPLLLKRSDLLVQKGYHAQAVGREINLFLLGDGFRKRIAPLGEDYDIAGQKWTRGMLLEELSEHPEHFSPNVILRPLFQQGVLPNIAFIGGGSEVAYWMQLTDIFSLYQVGYPVLIPRTSLLFVDQSSLKRMEKLGIQTQEIFQDKEELKKIYLNRAGAELPDLSREKSALDQILTAIKESGEKIDKTLGPAIAADAQRVQNTLNQIEGKMIRAVKHKNDTELKQIDSLYQTFFPDQILQERHDNFLNFYSRYGQKFIDWLVQHLHVIEQEFVVMTDTD